MGCSPCINVNLIPLKVLIFSFYGGLGCVLPFLTIHMKSLGFNVQETAFINFVLPFLCLLGPPIAGVIADKIGRYKPVMVCCLIMTALAYAGLLFVPETQRLSPRPPELSFTCSRDAGALVAERCSDTEACIHKDDNRVIEVAVRDCVVKCPNATLRRSVGTKDSYALMLSDAGPRSLESKADISPNLCSVDASGKVSPVTLCAPAQLTAPSLAAAVLAAPTVAAVITRRCHHLPL
ncbi:unnamed protein product [Notodromas monacha]|uniref:Major facilitator superfamily associated domain-containing protein n=1 Tax=Notodromas monacha TaxID=399045 RepID=A0A7R9GHB8_9CRUS|nr:unnamed protein product [Notodromas monacha]CAG0920744.1 unnamed protein product [Notodromas monacha]